jgi:NhaA family Na+:H+ antiporter
MFDSLRDFLKLEAAGGILLVAAAALAIVLANSPLSPYYDMLLSITGELRVGDFSVAKPALLWINDLWMAVFFFLVGLELKRELVEGELSDRSQIVLPIAAAIGGMLVPAGIYVAFNAGDSVAMNGWAIPAATDIAFALGVLALLGSRVPISLKIFLTSVAIIDDIGAIIIIAVFYSGSLSVSAMWVAVGCVAALAALNRRGVTDLPAYALVGAILWVAVLKSGVHATLAGVLLAFFIPITDPQNADRSPLRELEHSLHPVVAFFILPVFAFANAGVSLSGVSFSSLLEPVPLGIAAGLFFGKQVGVFLFCRVTVLLGLARLPEGLNWRVLYGAGILCGIGFTMSLFISGLAFEQAGGDYLMADRLGILTGSLLAGACGYGVLRLSLPSTRTASASE